MNYIKSKLRNSMSLKVLNAILTIKFGLIRVGKCCSTHDLPSHVLKEIGNLAAYQSHDVNQEAGASLSSDNSQSSQNVEKILRNCFICKDYYYQMKIKAFISFFCKRLLFYILDYFRII